MKVIRSYLIHDNLDYEESLLEYETIFNTTKDAIAIIKIVNQNKLELEKQNKKMELFLKCYPHLATLLINQTCIFDAVILEKTRHETVVEFDIHGSSYSAIIGIVPIIKNAIVIKLVLTILNISSQRYVNENVSAILTAREKEIAIYVSEGQKNEYIATKLGISVGTVKKTLSNVYKKLSINSRIELLKLFIKE